MRLGLHDDEGIPLADVGDRTGRSERMALTGGSPTRTQRTALMGAGPRTHRFLESPRLLAVSALACVRWDQVAAPSGPPAGAVAVGVQSVIALPYGGQILALPDQDFAALAIRSWNHFTHRLWIGQMCTGDERRQAQGGAVREWPRDCGEAELPDSTWSAVGFTVTIARAGLLGSGRQPQPARAQLPGVRLFVDASEVRAGSRRRPLPCRGHQAALRGRSRIRTWEGVRRRFYRPCTRCV